MLTLPKTLPRIEQVIEPESTDCPCGCGRMHKIGEERSERLDIIPAQLRVIVTVRPQYACRACTDGITQAPAPAHLIEGGLPSEGAIDHVLVAKYADHCPLYRQSQILARSGIDMGLAFAPPKLPVSRLPTLIPNGWANIPPKKNRKNPICFSPYLYRDRNHVERFFNRIKHCRRIRGMAPGQRLSARQARTAPLVTAFGEWLQEQRLRVSTKSRLGEKLAYIHRHWEGLQTFLHDGRVEIDSNSVENLIRPIALNRKNALFAGHDEGGRTWGRIASLIETAKINKIEPFAYLKTTLEAIAAGHPKSRIDELLPWNFTSSN